MFKIGHYAIKTVQTTISMMSNRSKNAVGTPVEGENDMSKTFIRNTLIITGIMVALLVIAIFNASIHASHITEINEPGNKLQEMVHFAVPNVIFYLF